MHDFDCPYCKAPQEVCHDDGFGLDESETFQTDCSECGKQFIFTTSFTINHYAEKADCLNDNNHDFQPSQTYPKIAARVRCTVCDTEDHNATAKYREQVREEYRQQGLDDIGLPINRPVFS